MQLEYPNVHVSAQSWERGNLEGNTCKLAQLDYLYCNHQTNQWPQQQWKPFCAGLLLLHNLPWRKYQSTTGHGEVSNIGYTGEWKCKATSLHVSIPLAKAVNAPPNLYAVKAPLTAKIATLLDGKLQKGTWNWVNCWQSLPSTYLTSAFWVVHSYSYPFIVMSH